jgi:hypothetical protein
VCLNLNVVVNFSAPNACHLEGSEGAGAQSFKGSASNVSKRHSPFFKTLMAPTFTISAPEHAIKSVTIFKSSKAEVVRTFALNLNVREAVF